MSAPTVLIYRSELLGFSETFIKAQASKLRSFHPVLAGLKRVTSGLPLELDHTVLAEGRSTRARATRFCYLLSGVAPRWTRSLAAKRPAIIHAHFATDGAEALGIARRIDAPLVVTLHGYDVMTEDAAHRKTWRGRVYLRRRAELWRRASLFLCVSEAIRQKALARGYPAEKLEVHRIGVDCEHLRPRTVAPRDPLILFVGRLVEKKGCSHLLRAMRLVRQRLPDASLAVLGDGLERERLKAEAEAFAPETIFLGAQSSGVVREWMARARVLAIPSVRARDGDAEGLPTVLAEAMAMGVPVAAFRTSGIPELAEHEREALLCEEGDVEGLAENLLRLCVDDELACRLSRAGRRRVETEFNVETQTAQLEQVYASVLAGSRATEARARVNLEASPSLDATLR